MELKLELALSSSNQDSEKGRKRTLDDAFLPLPEDQKQSQKLAIPIRNDDFVVVGWPPVKSWRKQFCHQNRRGCAANYVTVENSGGGGGGRSNFVKVKMEGFGIARKIDIRAYRSYQTLVGSLIALFGKCQENVEMYRLTYQDKEGDWLLAGDVPWGAFMQSVRRLKLQKNVY